MGERGIAVFERWIRALDSAEHFIYTVDEMPASDAIGEFEHFVLLAILRLGSDAYGVPIRAEIAVRTQREPSPGSLYTTLDRLEERGLVVSRLGEPTPQRGGRAKRYYSVSARGIEAVVRVQRSLHRLTEGLDLPGVVHA
jgi:DNA-binding PadR family transcriptional regulator